MRWWEHVAVHVQQHVVDALTGAEGTAERSYLDQHYQYSDRLAWKEWEEDGRVAKQ